MVAYTGGDREILGCIMNLRGQPMLLFYFFIFFTNKQTTIVLRHVEFHDLKEMQGG